MLLPGLFLHKLKGERTKRFCLYEVSGIGALLTLYGHDVEIVINEDYAPLMTMHNPAHPGEF